jgi:hypothetical protein
MRFIYRLIYSLIFIHSILWTYFDKKVPFAQIGIFNDQIKETNT